jgi:hypothetical protein
MLHYGRPQIPLSSLCERSPVQYWVPLHLAGVPHGEVACSSCVASKNMVGAHSTFHNPHSTFRIPHSTFRIPHSTFRTPHSAFHTPHSAFRTPHSTFHIPHSTLHIPHSTFHIPHSSSSCLHTLAARLTGGLMDCPTVCLTACLPHWLPGSPTCRTLFIARECDQVPISH